MRNIIFTLVILFTSFTSIAEVEFKENKHYEVMKPIATEKPQITEFFSFYCPHCYHFESTMEELHKKVPKNTEFNRVHVSFLGGEMGSNMSKAYATGNLLDKEQLINKAIFKAVQVEHQRFSSLDDIKKIFIKNDVTAEKFDQTINSFMVKGSVSKMEKDTKDFKINGVPSLVINGKYKINMQSIKSMDQFYSLVNYLLTQK